jgi:glycosyltransferase involved in cell wall biosynthesis
MISTHPFLSVILPVYQGSTVLPRSLQALAESDLPRECWELIVVDDGSTDDTASIAARYADRVVRLPGKKRGPAYARNRGFEVSRGECLVFVDADVIVHRDTLRRFMDVFLSEPDVGAVFGSGLAAARCGETCSRRRTCTTSGASPGRRWRTSSSATASARSGIAFSSARRSRERT